MSASAERHIDEVALSSVIRRTLNGSDLEGLSVLPRAEEYPPGSALFRQDRAPSDAYLLSEGTVILERLQSNGRSVTIDVRRDRSLIGAQYMQLDIPYPFTATAATVCRARRLSKSVFGELLNTSREFSALVMRLYTIDAVHSMSRIATITGRTASERMQHFLWTQVRDQGDARGTPKLRLDLKLNEIAQLLDITPGHLSRLLAELVKAKKIVRHKGWLLVPDPEVLWHDGM